MDSSQALEQNFIRQISTRIVRAVGGVILASFIIAVALPASAGEADPLMKAIVHRAYGASDVLRLEEVAKPVPNDNQVLIKVRAAAVNPLDWHFMRGTPYLVRADAGLFAPKNIRLGQDVAGEVEAVGKSVTQFKPGDAVYGAGGGAFGEYVRTSEKNIVLKPANVTFEQAAAIPIAAITALQALRDQGNLQPGQKVLINGASGGVGTFAVQIAKAMGADVTAVCSTRNVELVQSLGADHVVDYTKEDFTQGAARYELIIDNVGNHSPWDLRRVMTEHATAVMIGGGGPDEGKWIGPFAGVLEAILYSKFVSQEFTFFLADINQAGLLALNKLMEEKKLTSVIDRTYPLTEVPAAISYLEQGHARGKVVVSVAPER